MFAARRHKQAAMFLLAFCRNAWSRTTLAVRFTREFECQQQVARLLEEATAAHKTSAEADSSPAKVAGAHNMQQSSKQSSGD